MKQNSYVLAMYDIRSKQAFIYRSNSIKEIVGGSLIIRDCFDDYLYPAAETVGGKGIFHDEEVEFTPEGFESHIEKGYIGELIYDGGGNFLVVYRDIDCYRAVNYEFSKRILENIGTLQVLPTCIEGVDFDDYKGDNNKLYAKHRIEEGEQSFIPPFGSLPIVQVDYSTSEPLCAVSSTYPATTKIFQKYYENRKGITGIPDKLTIESYAKYKKYFEEIESGNIDIDEKVQDNLVQERGKESLLAVIYSDGNNMGSKVSNVINPYMTYVDCVRALREYSKEIQEVFVDKRKEEIDSHLESKYGNKRKKRYVIGSGDEITFICNARDAYDIMKLYLRGLPEGYSACAGAAIFHSHAPYSEAYRIAEECCESGKSFMKKHEIGEACFMDFYYCQGAIGTSLEEMRDEEVGDLISKPWLVYKEGTDPKVQNIKISAIPPVIPESETGSKAVVPGGYAGCNVEECRKALVEIGRSNVKGLAEAAKQGEVDYVLELRRIRAHMEKIKRDKFTANKWWGLLENNRELIYDMVIVFDIWFDESGKAGEK